MLAESLDAVGRHDLALQVRDCHVQFRGRKCKPAGHRWAKPQTTCRFRLCAFEMRARSARMRRRFREKFEALQRNSVARFAVFSERSCALWELAEGIVNLFDSFERLRHRVIWARRVTGCVAVLEVTFNEKENTWHPHLNVLWEGEYIPHAALLKAWVSCSRGRALTASSKAAGVRLEAIRDLAECFKYVTKLAPIVANHDCVEAFLLATHRVKLVRCYGSFYDLAADEDEHGGEKCPDCGSAEIEYLGRVYAEQVWFDVDGVIRYDCEETDAIFESPPRAGPDAAVSEEDFLLRYEEPRLFADLAAD